MLLLPCRSCVFQFAASSDSQILRKWNMKKIAIVCCYLGQLPNYFHLWLQSCAANPTIDWLFFTDQKISDLPGNVKCFPTHLEELRKLCKEKIAPETILPLAYKVCDYKPMYGVMFEEYLAGYDFWGYCDFDMIFGNLRSFFTEELLVRFDKILTLGHLSIYRNTPEINQRFRCPCSKLDLKKVIVTEKTCAFDEWRGIYTIYKENGFSMYDEVPFADISCMKKRLTLHRRSSAKYKAPAPDFCRQTFYWENGELYRAYVDGGMVKTDTFLYIHLARRKFPAPPRLEAFYCTQGGFVEKRAGTLPSAKEIQKLNPYYGKLYEWIETRIRRKAMKRENHRRFALHP